MSRCFGSNIVGEAVTICIRNRRCRLRCANWMLRKNWCVVHSPPPAKKKTTTSISVWNYRDFLNFFSSTKNLRRFFNRQEATPMGRYIISLHRRHLDIRFRIFFSPAYPHGIILCSWIISIHTPTYPKSSTTLVSEGNPFIFVGSVCFFQIFFDHSIPTGQFIATEVASKGSSVRKSYPKWP